MANLKEIKNRITSISSTIQITSAMKMVSASKLKRAQDTITQIRPYADKLKELLQGLSTSIGKSSTGIYTHERPLKNILLIAITSNKGLCGAFNTNVNKKIIKLAKEDYKNCNIKILTIGKKANDILSKNFQIESNKSDLFDELTFQNVSEIAQEIMGKFSCKDFDKVEIIYNRFKNAGTQIITCEQFLPILPIKDDNTINKEYIFEPSKVEILEDLVPKSLKIQLFKAVLDSYASEHGARMTAMHKATDNAKNLQDELKLTYNKVRQASITSEILEIVGGAEALNG